MGYTHYWKQSRRFTHAQWAEVVEDIHAILKAFRADNTRLADGWGENLITPLEAVSDEKGVISFNGYGEESHETFTITQERAPLESWQTADRKGCGFCKTARKAYDPAVTACLVYLTSRFPEAYSAGSDGTAADWQEGLDLARRALPRLDNVLTIPQEIMFDALFSAYHVRGGKFVLATLQDGTLCIADDSAFRIVGKFTTQEAIEWAQEWARRTAAKRQAKLPCKVSTLDRWEARQMRTFVECAPSFGYLDLAPVEA